MQQLLEFYEGNEERVGFVLKSGEIVEVMNICEKPEEGFKVSGIDLLRLTPHAQATWHTHPKADSNLSTDDWHAFLNYPELEHYIIGNDGLTKYVVENGAVLVAA